MRIAKVLVTLAVLLIGQDYSVKGQSVRPRVAILDFGSSATGVRAAKAIRAAFSAENEFAVIDQDLASVAARGVGFEGSLNLTVGEARDLGAAIGCDYYFIGDAQTLRRSPSTGAAYFDSYASIFLVSARTGRLVLWERPLVKGDTASQAEDALLQVLKSPDTHNRYVIAIRRALEDERGARIAAVEAPPTVIEVMKDEEDESNETVRGPRPYRRLKPPYPASAAIAEVEAVVDVIVDVDARGEIIRIEIGRWAGYGLDQSVVDTVKQMHFFPAMREGKPIPMRVLLRYNFRKPPK
jgi:TonB family protein